VKINLSQYNKYFPKDTNSVIPRTINDSDYKNWNFYYIFNLPDVEQRRGELKIRINEQIEKFRWDRTWLEIINKRVRQSIQLLKHKGYYLDDFMAKTSWRLIIGLGAVHPQETSMTLHHVYGIPYIPGSAVKGVTRHWIILSKFDNEEKKAEADEKFQKIFGAQKNQGRVIFMDAYPVGQINLKIDIMNPHYPDYYSKNIPPADWQNPNPIKFLTVENTKFRFYLLSKKGSLLYEAKEWLEEALGEFGIGAKTSLGYGIFEI
jgi:CRISPR-associated protein Cmr6